MIVPMCANGQDCANVSHSHRGHEPARWTTFAEMRLDVLREDIFNSTTFPDHQMTDRGGGGPGVGRTTQCLGLFSFITQTRKVG